MQIKSNDPRFGSSDMELTNIIQAEPSASMFVVPPGYTVKKGGPGTIQVLAEAVVLAVRAADLVPLLLSCRSF